MKDRRTPRGGQRNAQRDILDEATEEGDDEFNLEQADTSSRSCVTVKASVGG